MPERICSEPGCGRRHCARGYCRNHYRVARRAGVIDRLPDDHYETLFWSKVTKTTTCWLWTGCRSSNGYGSVGVHNQRRSTGPHRVAYEMLVGPIPKGLVLDHLCRVHHCVNPAHLEPVTPVENTYRGRSARTHCRRGHPFDQRNTRYLVNGQEGQRRCRACKNELERARRALAAIDRMSSTGLAS